MSSASAEHPQRALRRRRPRNDAPTSSPTPIAVLTARPITERRSAGIVAAGQHEQRDVRRADHAVGDRERERRGRRRPRGRTGRRSGTRPSRRRSRSAPRPPRDRRRSSATRSPPTTTTARPARAAPCARPVQVGSCAISAVHCVSASTKTRSKKSSSGITRSPSRIAAVSRGREFAWPSPSGSIILAASTEILSAMSEHSTGRSGRALGRRRDADAEPPGEAQRAVDRAARDARRRARRLEERRGRAGRRDHGRPAGVLRRLRPRGVRPAGAGARRSSAARPAITARCGPIRSRRSRRSTAPRWPAASI